MQVAARGGRPGSSPYDPAVRTSSLPPAQTGIDGSSSGRPHVLGHLFGVSTLRRDLQDARDARNNRGREAHAAISYDPPSQAVSELPAKMVYGKNP
jgi:hypothetical protein